MDNMNKLHKKPMSQSERSNNYKKRNNIQRIVLDLKPDDYNIIDNFCKNNNISKARFIVNCCKFCIDNNIDIFDKR